LILWRASRRIYADLSGKGGLLGSGRWHSKGRPIVYTAEHPALALLEVRVNLDVAPDLLPPDYTMAKISAPDSLQIYVSDIDAADSAAASRAGDQWLADGKYPLMRVRSVIAPESFNVLVNPLHRDAAEIAVVELIPFSFDARLFG
jgi:RES domain-containing protein